MSKDWHHLDSIYVKKNILYMFFRSLLNFFSIKRSCVSLDLYLNDNVFNIWQNFKDKLHKFVGIKFTCKITKQISKNSHLFLLLSISWAYVFSLVHTFFFSIYFYHFYLDLTHFAFQLTYINILWSLKGVMQK